MKFKTYLLIHRYNMTFRLRPISDKIVIEQFSAEDVSKGGIIIPDTNKDKPLVGKVLAVGPGRYSEVLVEGDNFIPMVVKEGEIVFFGRFAGIHIELEGKEYLVVRQDDVLVIDDSYKETKNGTERSKAK